MRKAGNASLARDERQANLQQPGALSADARDHGANPIRPPPTMERRSVFQDSKHMARNIEIKAHIDSIDAVMPKALAIATAEPTELHQDDTFFQCENGRLKLRTFNERQGELIFYQRADQAGPKTSFYLISRTTEPDTLREVLAAVHGALGRVIKHRTLIMTGRTRIHLDRVQGLGEFLELEVVLQDDEPQSSGIAEAHQIMAQLGVSPEQLIEDAYLDMLQRQK